MERGSDAGLRFHYFEQCVMRAQVRATRRKLLPLTPPMQSACRRCVYICRCGCMEDCGGLGVLGCGEEMEDGGLRDEG